MKKVVLCGAALGSALLVFGMVSSASAYPERTCSVDVQPPRVSSGDTFTARGHAGGLGPSGAVIAGSEIHWTFRFDRQTRTRTGSDVVVTFRAPEVTRTRTMALAARADSPAGQCVRHVQVTVTAGAQVSPPGAHRGLLPNTGGPAFWIVVAGMVLLVGGGGTVVAARRRQ